MSSEEDLRDNTWMGIRKVFLKKLGVVAAWASVAFVMVGPACKALVFELKPVLEV